MTDYEILSRPRFEILPTEEAEEQTGHLPSDAKVAVTCSPVILRWFDEHGVREIYVIGGDAKEPIGLYASALQMLGPQKASGTGAAR